MNLDLLKKLTALANNNPNDNEANLAARRVCKMLAECNFNLVDTIPPKSNNTTYTYDEMNNDIWEMFMKYGVNYRPTQRQQDFHGFGTKEGPKTWNDVHRSSEPGFKSGPTGNAYNPFGNRYPFTNFYEPPAYEYTPPEQSKPHKESRNLKCTKCGKMNSTKFVGHPDVYECNKCQWTEYTKSKVK